MSSERRIAVNRAIVVVGGADNLLVCTNRPLCTCKGEVSPQSGDNAVSKRDLPKPSPPPSPCCFTHQGAEPSRHCIQKPVSFSYPY